MHATIPDFHTSPRYLSATETARLMRSALKATFPGTKFSVRSDSNSINLRWTDGPATDAVKAVSDGFAGGRFDGMIDYAYDVTSWLMPSGAIVAHDAGTGGQRGSRSETMQSAPSPDAVLVRFGASYVFERRNYSDDIIDAAQAIVRRHRADGTLYDLLGPECRAWWASDDRTAAETYLRTLDFRPER